MESTVDFLVRDWSGIGLLDLSDHLVVVSTRQAGRRLREALARRAATAEAAVLPPLLVTPNFLFSPSRLEGEAPLASSQAAHLLWSAQLLRLPLDSYRRVFPVDPPERTLDWASAFAGQLEEVRDRLVESGLDFGAAALRFAEEGIESARWAELARLESAVLALFDRVGLGDPGRASLKAAEAGETPAGMRHLVVAAVPDLSPLAARAVDRLALSLSATVLVAAPASESSSFDDYGRPLPPSWREREIPFADPENTIHVCADPAAQAARSLRLLSSYPDPAACCGIGLPDPALAASFGQAFAAAKLGTYDPAGVPLSRQGIHHLLELLRDLAETERYDTFRQLLRCPGAIAALAPPHLTDPLPTGKVLRLSDEIAAEHFPTDLDSALAALRRNPDKAPLLFRILEGAVALVDQLEGPDFTGSLCGFLAALHAERRFHNHDPALAVLKEVAETIHTLENDLAAVAGAFPRPLRAAERLSLLLRSLAGGVVHPERGPRDLDLQGWLELPWDDAPHLLVAGMNDHAVPESTIGHAFLPDSARRLVGVADNEARYARDVFLLTLLAESRRDGGRLDLLFGRFAEGGDPLRPSRLLFQCQDEALPERTLRLFQGRTDSPAPLARTVAWPLRPRPLPRDHRIFQKISVTGFKSYLSCPFRYYLTRGLGMEKVEAGPRELDPRAFGNLIHAALESYGRDEAMRRSTDAGAIAAFFEAALDRWLEQGFGETLSTPLLVQREAARRRLARWAAIEAEQRALGWEILEVESVLGGEDAPGGGPPFAIGGMPVSGRIDRIERHPDAGLRVFDFKTLSPVENGTIKTVARFHLANLRRSDDPATLPDWILDVDSRGKSRRWIDLQIPLYHLALSQRFPRTPIAAGYATLGRTAEDVRIDLWDDLDETLLESAHRCAAGVVDSIRRGVFWPPNERMPDWDEFHALLSPTAEETVDPTGLDGAS